jgi:integrase
MAKFRADDGRVVMRSTKQTKRQPAQLIADEWERAAKKARAGELTQAVILKTMAEMMERGLGVSLNAQSTKQFFTYWIDTPGRKSTTVARYRPVLDGFIAFIGERRAHASVGSVTPSEVQRFRDEQIATGKTPTTANLAVKILRGVFNSARRLGVALTNPAEAVPSLDESGAEERLPFTPDQTHELLGVADREWRGMILLGYHTGIRLNDAANLTQLNVDIATRTLTFRDAKTSARKRRSKRDTVVYMHRDLLNYFESLPVTDDPHAPLFPSLFGKRSGSHAGLSNAFSRLMDSAGLRVPYGSEKRGKGRRFRALGFHSFRHTLISNLANADISADVRKEIAGHSSDEVHRRYVHLELSAQRRAIERIESIL